MTTIVRQDYGVQPNMKDKDESFVDFMQRTTWFTAMTKALQKHSEFMRPELGDYPNMEYAFPEPSKGNLDVPPELKDSELFPNSPCVITCYSPLYCDDNVKCHANIYNCPPGVDRHQCIANQTWQAALVSSSPAVALQIDVDPHRVFPIEIKPNGVWSHWPDAPSDKIHVVMKDATGAICDTDLSVFCRTEDCCHRSDYVAMTFDNGSTPDQVAPNSSITVYVSDGCGPFVWSVVGAGFTFTTSQTSGRTNTLNLANTACGGVGGHNYQGNITVSDECGTSVTATILATDGAWTNFYGFGRQSTCQLLACCGPQTCPGAPTSTVYHHAVGANKNEARWLMYVLNGCASDCREAGTGDHTFGGGSGCPADTIYGTEYCAVSTCCDCSGTLDYWTCGGNC